MANHINVFYAYPSKPESLDETITKALDELKKEVQIREAGIRFKQWNNLSITGKKIVGEIVQAIDRSDIFACDLTHRNLNVAFELGYAVGKFRRVFLSLDTTIQDASKEYKRLYTVIVGVGYAEYQNHRDLAYAFLNDHPWTTLDEHLLGDIFRRPVPRPELPTLLYVKPPLETDAVIATAEGLQGSMFSDSLFIDDPRENPSPTLDWHAKKIRLADAVLVHLLADNQEHAPSHNVKSSFVAGLAHGLGKPVLMLAHTPFDCPIDYQDLLKSHQTAQNCWNHVDKWLSQLNLPRRRSRRTAPEEARTKPGDLELRNLSIGEPVAEHEHLRLDEYFVETSAYYEALQAQTTIFVGRRGTGKTANLIALQTSLGEDKRNHVCTVKPVGYEVDGFIRVLQQNLHRAERGYLVESLWKFLIYSELASSVFNETSARPAYQTRTPDETKLVEYVETHSETLRPPFSQRLDRAVRSLIGVGSLADAEQQRARISELLHSSELRDLRDLLGRVLASRSKVAILIDNLDEPWRPGHEIEYLSDLLLGLLKVGQDITDDFERQDYWRKRVNVSVTMFIRSDIFVYVKMLAPEQDKLPIQRIVWHDEYLLLKVLDERLKHAVPKRFDARDIWQQLFPEEVVGLPTREFIVRNTLHRPRDVIYLVREAMARAVNQGRQVVTPEDFLNARQKYSQYVFNSILAEDDPRRGKLEAVLYEFAGAPREMSRSQVASRIKRSGVDESDVDFYLNLLCDVNFLGIQTTSGFSFASDEDDRRTLRSVAGTLAVEKGWGEESYSVNAAFHQVLQID
ncbi:MAG: hypothetical protein HYU86_02730 [Chloroflexi bacterium]|nr:hypothetical protein [Chloroflexota bacterium]